MRFVTLIMLLLASISFAADSTFVLELRNKMEAGDVDEQIELGRIYHLGQKAKRDLLTAFKLLKPLAEAGNARAEYEFGALFDHEESVIIPDLLSLRYKEIIDSLEKIYYVPESVKNLIHGKLEMEHDPEKWYRKAAEKGLVEAQQALGFLYYFGWAGDPRKTQENSIIWFEKASQQDDSKSQMTLGHTYLMNGNLARAYFWLNIAVDNGEEYANEILERVKERITDEQLEEAQQLLDDWHKSHKK